MTNPSFDWKNPASPARVILLGGILLDRYIEVDRYPLAGGDTLIRGSFDAIGGCSLNVAVTLKNLGSVPYVVTQWGEDKAGSEIEQQVWSSGLQADYMRQVPGGRTGFDWVVLDRSGERTFFTLKGCEGEVPRGVPQMLRGARFDFAYVTGYYLLNRQTAAAVLDLVGHFRENGCQVVFDPGPLVGEMDPAQLKGMLLHSDWLVPNAEELGFIEAKLNLGEDLAGWLLGQGCRGMVLKRGRMGVQVRTPTGVFTESAFPVVPVDTTGAGDSFAGGLMYGLSAGYPLRQAITLASACGAFLTTLKGPHGAFSKDDILNFIQNAKDNPS